MLAKKYKLDLRRQANFFKTAQQTKTKQFVIYWKPAQIKAFGLQFQVTVVRGIVQSIVERNALKRIVYNLCALLVPEYPKSQLLIVIVIRKANLELLIPALTKELKQLLTYHS